MRKIASNDTKEGRGNCTYVLPKDDTTQPTGSTDGMSTSVDDTNSTGNSGANSSDSSSNSSSPSSNSTISNSSTTVNASVSVNASSVSQIIAQAIAHNGGKHNIITIPENDTASPSEPAANSTIVGGASTVSNSTSNSTGNGTSNSTANTTVDDSSTAYANVSLNGPTAQQMAREVHYLLDPTPLELVTKALG